MWQTVGEERGKEGGVVATSHVHEVQQQLAEVQALLAHLETARWTEADWEVLPRVVQSYVRLLGTLVEAPMTLKRLQGLRVGTRRRGRHAAASGSVDAPERPEPEADTGAAGETAGGTEPAAGQAPRAGGHRPGVGRLRAEAYVGAERVACRHEALQVGQGCAGCGQGRPDWLPPGMEIRHHGEAPLAGGLAQV